MVILNESLRYLNESFFNWLTFIIFIVIGIFVGLIICLLEIVPNSLLDKGEKILITIIALLFTGTAGAGIGAVAATKTHTVASKRQYEIYLTDMTYEELVDCYTIVDTVGKKIIIEDKEWQYYKGYEK